METGWLIEKGQLCLGLCGSKPAWVTFTNPTAIRFSRKEDAENMVVGLKSFGDGVFSHVTISEHGWGV